MNDDRVALARLVSLVADDLEHRGYPPAGIVRRAAQALATVPASPDGEHCPVCGGPVVQPATGRRRVYCSTPCKRKANRSRNATVAP